MKNLIPLSLTVLGLTVGAAVAQTTIVPPANPVIVTSPPAQPATSGGGAVGGATTGAVAGAIVGGPVGAAVGGLAGAVVGEVTEGALTPETRTYVMQNRVQSVTLDAPLAVGAPIPQTVQIQPIPDSQYQYVYVNEQPVIVDPQTRKVIYIVQ